MLKNEKGMTLMEIMIVIAIMGGLMALLVPNLMNTYTKAKVKQSEIQLNNLKNALRTYLIDCGNYPTSDAGLAALTSDPGSDVCRSWGPSPYIDKHQLRDQFGHEFEYESDGQKLVLTFLGKDGRKGGKDFNRDIEVEEGAE